MDKNPDELEPTLKVRMGEEVFGYGQISAPSDGTLKLKGEDARSFTIYTDRKIGPSEILEGSLSVVSVPNQYGKPVYPSGGLIKREERYFSEYFARLPETLKSAIKDQLDVNVALAPKKPESENELSYMHFPVGLAQIFHPSSDGHRNPLPSDFRWPSALLPTPKSAGTTSAGARLHRPGL